MVLQGVLLAPQATHKFLGVLLDQELWWSHQASSAIAKALWPSTGICPCLMRQLFNAVAVPKMAYAANIWYTPVSKRQGRTRLSGSVGITGKLVSLQRMAMLAITGALHSTVIDVLDLHADVLPVELLLNKICHWAFLWLASLAPTHPLQKLVYTHAKHYIRSHHSPLHELANVFDIDLKKVEVIALPSFPPGHWLKYTTTIQSTVEELAACARSCHSELVIYSDGSSLGGHTGTATVMYKAGQNPKVLKLHLGTLEEHMTYEVEVAGLSLALHLLSVERGARSATVILDNQSVIQSLRYCKSGAAQYLVCRCEGDTETRPLVYKDTPRQR